MKMHINTMIAAMTEELKPVIAEVTVKGVKAMLGEARERTDDPLAVVTLNIIEGWVDEHGTAEAVARIEQLATSLSGDGAGIKVIAEQLTAEQLTELTDAYQSAESASRLRTRRGLERLGRVVAEASRYIGRAAIAALAGA